MKTKDGIVLGADKMHTYIMQNDESFATKVDKIFPIGKNTLMGFSGNGKNQGMLIKLLEQNSKKIDNDLFSGLTDIKGELRKIYLDCRCLFCGTSKGEPVIVELSADKEQKQLDVELITDSYGIVGELMMGFSIINEMLHPYFEYAKKTNYDITNNDAEFLVYTAINNIAKSGITNVGKGIDIWTIKNKGNELVREQVSDWKINDLFETGYSYYKKKAVSAIDETLRILRELDYSKNGPELRNESTKQKARSKN